MDSDLRQLVLTLNDKVDTLTQEVRALRQALAEGTSSAELTVTAIDELAPSAQAMQPAPEVLPSRALPMEEVLQIDIPRPRYASQAEVFRAMFAAALDSDERRGFVSYLGCIHSEILTGRLAIAEQREFNWKKLRRNVSNYLVNDDPTSVHIVRTVPDDPDDGSLKVKYFVHSESRSPAPVILQRDPAYENTWRVYFSSL